MDFKDSIVYKLHSITYSMDAIADVILKQKYGVSYNQLLIMLGIYYNPGVTQKYIEDFSLLTNAAVSKIINQLLSMGLVLRDVSQFSRRENTITLTTKGKELVEQSTTELNAVFNKYLKGLSPSDQEKLNKLLGQVVTNINY